MSNSKRTHMKKLRILITLLSLVAWFTSCEMNEIDNYPQPNAGLSGKIVDVETGEPVQQDIIRGAAIEIREHGYDPVTPQYLIIKNDGTYANTRLFANTYTVQPVRGNFKVVEAKDVVINGQTTLDFLVTPYIRIKEAKIERDGDIVRATFKMEQTSVNNVLKIGLYAHRDPHVGEPMQLAKKEINVNTVVDVNQVYTIEMDLFSDPDLVNNEGKVMFFRIGALIDVPEAKYNYAPALDIQI
jgi:hypothetical protein